MSFEVVTNSPLESRLTKLIMRLIESGYIQRGEEKSFDLIRNHAFFSVFRSNRTTEEGENVGIITSYLTEKIFTYITIFSAGYFTAAIIFFTEIAYFRHTKNMMKQRRFLRAKKRTQNIKHPSYRPFQPTYNYLP